jgi:hypothetical protein
MMHARNVTAALLALALFVPGWAGATGAVEAEISSVESLLGTSLPTELTLNSKLSSGYRCSPWRFLRSPRQVMVDHQAALLSGDMDKAMCDYAPHARVLSEGGVQVGRDQIRAGFEGMAGLFGGIMPNTTGIFDTGEVVMVTWEVFTPMASIPDGVDTFVVRFGQIIYQTVHAKIQFN